MLIFSLNLIYNTKVTNFSPSGREVVNFQPPYYESDQAVYPLWADWLGGYGN